MPTSDELKQEGRQLLYGVFVGSLGMMTAAKYKEDIYRFIDCIIEAVVMEAVEKMKGHSHDHSHFSPSDTLFR